MVEPSHPARHVGTALVRLAPSSVVNGRSRSLLKAVSIVCALICICSMGMWLWSYTCDEGIHGSWNEKRDFQLVSMQGRLAFLTLPKNSRPGLGYWPQTPLDDHKNHEGEAPIHYDFDLIPFKSWQWSRISSPAVRQQGITAGLGLSASYGATAAWLIVPYWLLVLTSGSLAMLSRIQWPGRFNLRSLFVAVTFLAIVLGMSAWLDRSWIGK
jgi:hypothetical protein